MGNSGGGAPGSGRFGTIATPALKSPFPAEWMLRQDSHVHAWHLEVRQRKWEANQRAKTRLNDIINWLAQCCRDSAIQSFARFRSGGALWPIKPWEWNVDNPLDKFVVDGGPKRHFTELKHSGPYEAFLFFARADLDRLFEQVALSPLQVSKADLARLSPYLQMAVRLALQKGYFDKECSYTQAVREAEVRAAWPQFMEGVPISNNTIQQVARLMGFPDPEAIVRGKRGGRGKTG